MFSIFYISTISHKREMEKRRFEIRWPQIANFIPKFWLTNPCISRTSAKTSGYSFLQDKIGYAECRHNQGYPEEKDIPKFQRQSLKCKGLRY